MSTAGRSLIAGANAWFRAKESRLPAGERILDDPWAERLAERNPRIELIRLGRFLLPPLGRAVDELRTAHCVRHRAIDELLLRAVEADGFRQVVVVGSGYDMRLSRFDARLRDVRWIEVDQPAMLARKWRLLDGAAGVRRDGARLALDLATDSLAAALAGDDFDPAAATCFVVEGVIHYLEPARLALLLDAIAGVGGPVRAIVSFIRSDVYQRATPTLIRLVRALDELPRLHFTPEELAALCARHGLVGFRSWSLEEQIEAFAPEARGRRVGLAQDVAQIEARERAPGE